MLFAMKKLAPIFIAFLSLVSFQAAAKADITKDLGKDFCVYQYRGDNPDFPGILPSNFGTHACLAKNGTVFCGLEIRCGVLNSDFYFKRRNVSGGYYTTILHFKQEKNNPNVLLGYACYSDQASYYNKRECTGPIRIARFNYTQTYTNRKSGVRKWCTWGVNCGPVNQAPKKEEASPRRAYTGVGPKDTNPLFGR